MVTIEQLEKQISIEKQRIEKQKKIQLGISKKKELERELFNLQNREAIEKKQKFKSSLRKGGKFILAQGKKLAPKIQKQVKLIREQQLRDDALARKRAQASRKIPKPKKLRKAKLKAPSINPLFGNLDF